MDRYRLYVIATLFSIVALGILSIRLIIELEVPAFLVYTSYVLIAVFFLLIPLSAKGSKAGFTANILLAITVMVVNTSIRDHMVVLLSPEYSNASLVLLIGAYVLQPILIITSLLALRARKSS
ncbi:MAG: hypothetical protein FJ358_04025 [Thaumarchaeota archaeon]|nr:hypothetical protein [Nitrososphaerota archaeon]